MTSRAYGGRRGKSVEELGYDPDAWSTPQWLFDELNAEFRFKVDAFASADNAKCDVYVTNAFERDWSAPGLRGATFGNPPYSIVGACLDLAYNNSLGFGDTWVMLVKADTSTRWWHEWYPNADEVRFLKRIQFIPPPGYPGKVGSPNMGHALLIFRGRK